MMPYNPEWDMMGRRIQEIVDQAVNSQDFRQLNQTIRRTVERAVTIGGQTVRRTVERTAYSENKPQAEPLPALYADTKLMTIGGIARIAGGVALGGVGVLSFATAAMLYWMFWEVGMFPLLGVASFTGGAVLMGSGIKRMKRLNRFKAYVHAMAGKTQCALERLAQSVGGNVASVRKDVKKMIRDGLFLEGHLNKEETCLITSHETYHLFEQSRLQLEQRMQEEEALRKQEAATRRDPQVQEVLDRGDAFVRQIRKCNDDIPGEEISAKIDKMETIVRRIFQRVRTNPEIVPDLKKLMDYYLPMTVKLLNAYADMDAQPVQGENILSSKREIEATLDTLNLAFEKLLDDLFMDAAMDVSSDITVLNTMLAQEGLMDDELTKMRKQKVEGE